MASSGTTHRNPWAHIARARFFWLLVSLIGFILAAPLLPTSSKGQWEMFIMALINFFAAIFISQGTTRLWAMGTLAVGLLTICGYYIFDGDPSSMLLAISSIVMITLIYTSGCVLSFVLEEGAVKIDHIIGAVCAYVLIAMAFGNVYYILELIHHNSFNGVHVGIADERPWWQFFYFSFSTLSTVGYGDIVPATMQARSFTIIEQLVAVFYVAILISRLTGMYTSSSKAR